MTPQHNLGGPKFWQDVADDLKAIKESQAALMREQNAMREQQKAHDEKTDKIVAVIWGDQDHPERVGILETLRNHDDRITLRGTLLTIFGGVFFWLLKIGKELWDRLHSVGSSHTLPPGTGH